MFPSKTNFMPLVNISLFIKIFVQQIIDFQNENNFPFLLFKNTFKLGKIIICLKIRRFDFFIRIEDVLLTHH